jgi:hypothetical protein
MAKLKREDAIETVAVDDGSVVLDGQEMSANTGTGSETGPSLDPAGTPAKTRKPRTPRDPNAVSVVWDENKFGAVLSVVQGIADGSVKGGLTPVAILAALKGSDAFTPTEMGALTPLKVASVVKKLRKAYDSALDKGEITADQYVEIPELEHGKTPKLNASALVRIASGHVNQAAQASA